jgi:thiosulfate dehydrogenase
MKPAVLATAFAALALGGALTWYALARHDDTSADIARVASPEYGQELIRNTVQLMGSGQADPSLRASGNSLACASCHLESGQKPGMLSLLQSAAKYPTFSGRDGGIGDLTDRINGCMQRSMNGSALHRDSVEMQSMVAYVEQLGRQYEALGASRRSADEPAAFVEPERQANVENGARVYGERCAVCHGANGEGLHATTAPADGYLFPPLWGPESYNIGAGMARLLTAARFIKARMPLGNATLTDDEAFDVAAYMNSQPRPSMANLEQDYPDRKLKPVDSPYPPYADPFPPEQHRLGPFAPIRAYYSSN